MAEFIKSIFTTPVNLWNLGQCLFALLLYGVGISIFYAIIILISLLTDLIKTRRSKNRRK